MAKRKRGRHRSGGRTTPKGTRPHGTDARPRNWETVGPTAGPGFGPVDEDVHGFDDELLAALEAPSPFELCWITSAMTEAMTERQADRIAHLLPPSMGGGRGRPDDEAPPDAAEFVESLAPVNLPHVGAVVRAVTAMIPDEHTRRRLTKVLAANPVPGMPTWVDVLDTLTVTGAVEMTHVLGDGDNIFLDMVWADGSAASFVVYIDHNLGTLVKDAFAVPEALDDLLATYRHHLDADPQAEFTTFTPISLADARARIEGAIEIFEMTVPPIETDTWPNCRPLLEQALRSMPDGGTGYEHDELSEAERDAILDDFAAAPEATSLKPDDGHWADSFLRFATGYGPGDPLRWSPVSVELLLDWIPRKVMTSVKDLARAPKVLRCFVRYAHRVRGIDTVLTEETLAAIDRWEPNYRHAIGARGGRSGRTRTATFDEFLEPSEPQYDAEFANQLEAILTKMREEEVERLGGWDAVDALDTEPLPDEPLDLSVVPDDLAERVTEIAALADAVCDQVGDVQIRTITRRILTRVADRSPAALRRRGRPDLWAAALVGAASQLNGVWFRRRKVHGTTIAAAAGVKSGSVGQKVQTVLASAELLDDLGRPIFVPELSHSEVRALHLRSIHQDW